MKLAKVLALLLCQNAEMVLAVRAGTQNGTAVGALRGTVNDGSWGGCRKQDQSPWSLKSKPLRFIHIPRTAGTTIESCSGFFPRGVPLWGERDEKLRGLQGVGKGKSNDKCYGQHVPPSMLVNSRRSIFEDRTSTFCVVRDPYDRLVSQFGFINLFGTKHKYQCTAESMNTYLLGELQKVHKGRTFLADCHFTPQSLFVFGYDPSTGRANRNQRWCQKILRFDGLAKNFNSFMEQSGYGVRILDAGKKDGRLQGSSPDCRALSTKDLSPEVIALANEIYKDDFETLGFQSRKATGAEAIGSFASVMSRAKPRNIVDSDKIQVWILYSYSPESKSSVVELDLKALRRNADSSRFQVNLVNETNVRDFLPDIPEEYDRLPDFGARSDFLRAGLLANHGGMYLDADVLVTQSLDVFTQRLKDNDLVSYTSDGQDCQKGQFSSNVVAVHKGDQLSMEWWKQARAKLKQGCAHKSDRDLENGICCFEPDGRTPRRCHIPWGGLGEQLAHPILTRLLKEGSGKHYRISCFNEKNHMGFAPDSQGKILWRQFVSHNVSCGAQSQQIGNQGSSPTALSFSGNCPCWEPKRQPAGDLECADGQKSSNLFGRMSYHLFSHINGHFGEGKSEEAILQGNWVVSRLFRVALGLPEPSK